MSDLWVSISYNNDGDYDANCDACVIGIFSSRELAKQSIIKEIKKEFDDEIESTYDLEEDERFSDFVNLNNLTWANICPIFNKELKKNECRGLLWKSYKCSSHKLTTK